MKFKKLKSLIHVISVFVIIIIFAMYKREEKRRMRSEIELMYSFGMNIKKDMSDDELFFYYSYVKMYGLNNGLFFLPMDSAISRLPQERKELYVDKKYLILRNSYKMEMGDEYEKML